MENRAKLENAQFPRTLKGSFYCLSLNGKNTRFCHSDPNFPFDSRIEPENSKKLCF